MADRRPRLSLIVPAYNEQESAGEIVGFYREIARAHASLEVELVLVDDGSDDGTAEAVRAHLTDQDPAVVVSLSRNFGSHAAITAGLSACTGDAALTLSADRQEPLSAVADFVAEWQDGADVVWGLRSVRATRKGASETFATTFSRVFNKASTVPTYPQEGPSQILVTRQVIDVLEAMPENNRNVLAMVAWSGFEQRRIFFEQLPRPHGVSKWTSSKKIKLVVDSFVEFSSAPVRWVTLAGVGLGALGALLLLAALVLALVPGTSGTVALVCGLVLLVGGLNLFALGVVGEYVWRAGDDARRRPVYIARGTWRTGSSAAPSPYETDV
ncbi:glycosyltransferase family 2 protein [Cellulosimicrobium protaetiae]|uniref:Glycosyltransferase family 2 protein n=1 Tax=Cellulosimicrobium protaetiae TaxID=2587808 RepID=A0A6M5UFQ5_9MICO|nr:glycosyltransferase family 2 protein [Cellulosimicrobium protaetiae]QJW36105.1 glycosyltransferase family 2 protein [Cellulosimicrobium protaetiae]